MEEKLRELYPDTDEETIKQASVFSLGKAGKAIALINDANLLNYYRKMYNDLCGFLKNENITDRFLYVKEIVEDPQNVKDFFDVLVYVLRSRLLEQDSVDAQETLMDLLKNVEETKTFLKRNVNARLALENLMLSL